MTSLRISEVSARSGVPASALRYYDQRGLVPAERSANGYRVYTEDALDRLRFIAAARRLDLSLDDIADLLQAWERDPCASVSSHARALIADQLATVEDGIGALGAVRDHLESARAHLEALPGHDGPCTPSCISLLDDTAPPVACALGADRGEQIARWRALLGDRTPERVGGGVRYRLPIGVVGEAALLAASEQECCPFFGFDISLRGDVFTLSIRAPEEGMPLLTELTGIPNLDEPVHASGPRT